MTGEQYPRESCYFCGDETELETHHVFPRRYGGGDSDSNLVDVCPACHKKLESLYADRGFWSKIDISKGEHPPVWADFDEIVVVEVDELGEQDIREFRPEYCARCRRYGPFRQVTHQPTGATCWQCTRCSKDPPAGNRKDWCGLHLLTAGAAPDQEVSADD